MKSFPFDSLALYQDEKTGLWMGDRQGSAQDVRDINKIFWKNGVCMAFENAFQVSPGEGMNVIVAPGVCGIEGTLGIEDSERGMTLQASSSEDRIDTIVLRLNLNVEARKIDLYVKTGVAQSVPVRPQLTHSESVWELGIADIFVAKNSGAISAARITDTRLQTERCGAMAPLMEVDTTSFYDQLQAQTQIAVDLAQSAIDGTTAGNLQNQITANREAIETNSSLDDERWNSLSQTTQTQSTALSKLTNYLSTQFRDAWGDKATYFPANSVVEATIPITPPAGYKLFSLHSFSTNANQCSVMQCNIDASKNIVHMRIHNFSSAAFTVNVSASVNCIKTF